MHTYVYNYACTAGILAQQHLHHTLDPLPQPQIVGQIHRRARSRLEPPDLDLQCMISFTHSCTTVCTRTHITFFTRIYTLKYRHIHTYPTASRRRIWTSGARTHTYLIMSHIPACTQIRMYTRHAHISTGSRRGICIWTWSARMRARTSAILCR